MQWRWMLILVKLAHSRTANLAQAAKCLCVRRSVVVPRALAHKAQPMPHAPPRCSGFSTMGATLVPVASTKDTESCHFFPFFFHWHSAQFAENFVQVCLVAARLTAHGTTPLPWPPPLPWLRAAAVSRGASDDGARAFCEGRLPWLRAAPPSRGASDDGVRAFCEGRLPWMRAAPPSWGASDDGVRAFCES